MASKVLIIGAPNGRFREAFAKANALSNKTVFDIAIVVGDLFAPDETSEDLRDLLNGTIKPKIPTYFGLGVTPLPEPVQNKIQSSAGQVCENLFFLGKKAILTTSEGIRIVALGGTVDPGLVATSGNKTEEPDAALVPLYSDTEANSLVGANYADILLTYDWPEGVESGSKVPLREKKKESAVVSKIAKMLRPRYHFCPGGETFWEREPYRNEVKKDEQEVKVTRFLALGDWANSKKAKAVYAFNINPKETNAPVPDSATVCPYIDNAAKGKKRPAEADGSGSFFWGDQAGPRDGRHGGKRGRGRGRGGRDRGPPPGPESCFFCLSYTQLEKHLIVSIGDESYLTTAKGPLTSPETNPRALPFSSHILIIPLTHAPTIAAIDDSETREKTLDEMHRYRLAIEKMLATRGCGAVTFEVARAGGVHAHWQLIPISSDKLASVEKEFDEAAKDAGVGEFEDDNDDPFLARGDFFRTWISGREKARVLRLDADQYFDLQFGRKVAAKVIGAIGVNWRDCILGFDGELEDAEKFKQAFKEFDFSLG